jgi:hypothetical protein
MLWIKIKKEKQTNKSKRKKIKQRLDYVNADLIPTFTSLSESVMDLTTTLRDTSEQALSSFSDTPYYREESESMLRRRNINKRGNRFYRAHQYVDNKYNNRTCSCCNTCDEPSKQEQVYHTRDMRQQEDSEEEVRPSFLCCGGRKKNKKKIDKAIKNVNKSGVDNQSATTSMLHMVEQGSTLTELLSKEKEDKSKIKEGSLRPTNTPRSNDISDTVIKTKNGHVEIEIETLLDEDSIDNILNEEKESQLKPTVSKFGSQTASGLMSSMRSLDDRTTVSPNKSTICIVYDDVVEVIVYENDVAGYEYAIGATSILRFVNKVVDLTDFKIESNIKTVTSYQPLEAYQVDKIHMNLLFSDEQ